MSQRYDVAVVGAGIIGLTHAYHLGRQGRKVIVFERSPKAQGASVRNFGMIWPIGQPAGTLYTLAQRSRALWKDALQASGLWHEETGSLHLAYREDEAQVLREFVARAQENGYDCALWNPEQVAQRTSSVRQEGLQAALWSPTEMCVDPREVVAGLPAFLSREFGVEFAFGCAVTAIEGTQLTAGGKRWKAGHCFVCSGDDFQTLYPALFAASGLSRCKLQMMRSEPGGNGQRIGPMLAAGLTLRHYASFRECPSLSALKARIAAETPEYDRYGIHVMASQNGRGEIVIGDSHEYGDAIEPFDKETIDALVLNYLQTFLAVPDLRIASRWHGIYSKHPTEPYFLTNPEPGVTLVTGVGGAGMTLSFGLSEQIVHEYAP
jgi:FAD dependent oxidoreductase TIGR03364